MNFKNILTLITLVLSINSYAFDPKDKPVQVVIPFGPGGGTDTVFRKLQKYGDQHGINLTPIYRPGATGMIGMQAVYDSPSDGMTFGVITFDTVTIFSSKSSVDLNNIVTIQKNTFGVVTNKNTSLKEIVSSITDKKPMKIGYLLFSQKAIMQSVLKAYGVKSDQIFVPYKAGSEMIQNAINGDIDIAITSLNVLAPLVKVGKLKLIATDATTIQHDFEDVP
jgi:tripartite-type tricarboxylate transporter receptor subunit TctC